MQDLLDRLKIQGATIAQLSKTLERINRKSEDFPEGEDLGPLAYEVKQDMRSSAIAPQKGFTPVSTKSKAPKAIAPVVSDASAPAPTSSALVVIGEFEIDLSQPPDYDNWTDEHLDAYDSALQQKEARMRRRAAIEARQRSISQLTVSVNEDRALSLELDAQALDASIDLKQQEVLLRVQQQEAPRLLSMVAETSEEVARDNIARTEKAIGVGKSLALDTPVPAQVSVGRLLQRRNEMRNRVMQLDNKTAALLPSMRGEDHQPDALTLEAVAV